MSSPYLKNIFYITGGINNNGTVYFNLYNMIFNNVSSSVFYFNTNYNLSSNYYINMNVYSSLFTTTALNIELNNNNNNNNKNNIKFFNNIFKNYITSYAENYLFNLLSFGSLLKLELYNNYFDNGTIDVDYYIFTNGPFDIYMISQNIDNDSKFLQSIDPLNITILNHNFGSNFNKFAINIIRKNIILTPLSSIKILNCNFINNIFDYEMLSFYNIQSADSIIINNCNFIHSYIRINYGSSLSYVDLSSSEIYSFNILNSNFSNYNNNSTFYINDFF